MGMDVFPIIMLACFVLFAVVFLAIDHPTSQPYATRPEPDGLLTYRIIPVPDIVLIERDVMVTMPDGIELATNVYRP